MKMVVTAKTAIELMDEVDRLREILLERCGT
jgi:hypothetical protein